jgi:hypothetical protein
LSRVHNHRKHEYRFHDLWRPTPPSKKKKQGKLREGNKHEFSGDRNGDLGKYLYQSSELSRKNKQT